MSSGGRQGPKTEKGPCNLCGWRGIVSVAQKKCTQIVDKGGGVPVICKGELKRAECGQSSSSALKKREREEDDDGFVVYKGGEIKRINSDNPLSDVLKEHLLKMVKSAIKTNNGHPYWGQFETCCEAWRLNNTSTNKMDPFIQRGRFENIYRIKIDDDIERPITPKEENLLIKFDERKMIVTIEGDNTDDSGEWTADDFDKNCSLRIKVAFQVKFDESLNFAN